MMSFHSEDGCAISATTEASSSRTCRPKKCPPLIRPSPSSSSLRQVLSCQFPQNPVQRQRRRDRRRPRPYAQVRLCRPP
jgi:hypothetical protein